MLKRVMAPEGSGKTTFLLETLLERAKEKANIFVIVPEQTTADTERAVLKLCGAQSNDFIEITNFSRLSNLVLRSHGGIARRFLSKTDQKLLLASCGQALAGSFSALSVRNLGDFAEETQSALRELRLAGIGKEELAALADGAELEPELKKKLADLHLLQNSYRASLRGRFDDPDEEAEHLAKLLENIPFFRDSYIFIDSFWDFTAPELQILAQMLRQAREVMITFCCEKGENPLFTKGKNAARAVLGLARKYQIPTEDFYPAFPEKENEITFLKKNLLHPAASFAGEDGSVELYACKNRFEEAQFVADKIARLVSQGAKWREIAVLSRSGDEDRLFGFLFDQYGIPHFSEERHVLAESAPAETVLRAVQLATGDLRGENVRQYLKNAILPISEEERFLLKKYATTWNLSGKIWLDGKDFVMNPDGYQLPDRESARELAAVNAAKHKVFDPLRALSLALAAGKTEEKAAAVISFLSQTGAEEHILKEVAEKKARGEWEEAGKIARNWNQILERLGSLVRVAGEQELENEAFSALLALALSGEEGGAVPPGQDIVMLGALPFTRQSGTKYIFITGFNSGSFPPEKNGAGLLTEREKEELGKLGYAFSAGVEAQMEEYFLFYLGLSFASEKLYLSYSTGGEDDAGDALSVIGKRVQKLLPHLQPTFFDAAATVPKTRESAFRYLCANPEKERADIAFLTEYFKNTEPYRKRLLQVLSGKAFLQGEFSLQKYLPYEGKDVNMTYSRLETYSKCRFAYFAQYLLEAKPLEKAEFGFNRVGSFVHEVMEKMLLRLSAEGKKLTALKKEELRAMNEEICREVLGRFLPEGAGERMRYLAESLFRSTLLLLTEMQKEFSVSLFEPIFMEKKLSDLGGYHIPLPDGKELVLYGDIDRVDLYRSSSGAEYVRVVDYKTGGHSFSLANVANGIDVQMLIYLFALWNNGFEYDGRFVKPLPAGILYLNGVFKPQTCKNREELEELARGEKTMLSRAGMLLDEDEVLAAQDPEKAGFLPLQYEKNGARKKNNLITLERFGSLKKKVERDFARLAGELKAGRIEALPLYSERAGNVIDPCRYCRFKPICKNQDDHKRAYRFGFSEAELYGEEDPHAGA